MWTRLKNKIGITSLLKASLASVFVALVGGIMVVHAVNKPLSPVNNVQDIQDVLCQFIAYFFWIVITLSVIFILVAAYYYVTAGDDTEKTSKARRTLTYGAVGVSVALCAVGFPAIVGTLPPPFNNPLIPQCTPLGA